MLVEKVDVTGQLPRSIRTREGGIGLAHECAAVPQLDVQRIVWIVGDLSQ